MKTFNQWARAAGDRPKPMTEVSVVYRGERGKQVAVSDGTMKEHIDKTTGEVTNREDWRWLPKSEVRVEGVSDLADLVPGRVYTVHLPEWLALDRGLI